MAAETGRQKAWWLIDEGWFYQLRMGGIWESILAKGKRENSSPLASPRTLLSTLLRLVNPDTEVVVCHFQGYLPIGWCIFSPVREAQLISTGKPPDCPLLVIPHSAVTAGDPTVAVIPSLLVARGKDLR